MSPVNRRRHAGGTLVLAFTASLLALTAALAQGKGTVKIATQSPLSGNLAALGEGIKLGTQLAVAKLKGPIEQAGFKVELVMFDDQSKPDVGVANARKIVADKNVLAVIGHLDAGVTVPSSDVYREASLVMISPACSVPMITDRGYANVNRVLGRDDVQGLVAARFAREQLNVKSVYIVHDKTRYGQNVAEFFRDGARKNALEVLALEDTQARTSVDALLSAIRARNPDLVYVAAGSGPAATIVRQARQHGVKAKFMGPATLDSPELLQVGGDAVVGTYFTTVAGTVREYPRAKEFADDYRKTFGKEPQLFAAHAYDATAIAIRGIEAAIREAGAMPTRDTVAKAVRNVRHDGITGRIEFNAKGDPIAPPYMVYEVGKEWTKNSRRIVVQFPPPPPPPPQ